MTRDESAICGEPCPYGGSSAVRKYARPNLGWMGHCNRVVKKQGDKCWQHKNQRKAASGS